MPCKHKLLCLALLAIVALSTAQQCNDIPDNQKLDCLPDEKVVLNSSDTCISYGCCWNPPTDKSIGLKIGVPSCYFPSDHTGYSITGLQTTNYGHKAVLTYVGPAGRRSEIINTLTLEVYHYESRNIVRVKIVDAAKARYEVPESYPFSFSDPKFSSNFKVTVNDNKLVIRDKADKLLFSTALNAPIIYTAQFIQISTQIESQYAYGFGETSDVFAKPTNTWRQYSLFALDQPPGVGVNAYGVHPFGMFLRDDSSSYGLFLLNSNAMDIEITPLPSLTFRTIGGVIDLFLYAGSTPQEVIQQHWAVIGNPIMPPYWAFGFHLSRWGYENQQNLEAMIKRNVDNFVPFEAQWFDIDTFDRKYDWTIDPVNFGNLSRLVDDLHKRNMFVVPIVDPAIPYDDDYEDYKTGKELDIFIKDNNLTLVGQVWPGNTTFPDFTNNKTEAWWLKSASDYKNLVNFDGLWIDMNEPANFVHGSNIGCGRSIYDDPPYVPQVRTDGEKLKFKTICMSSDQALGKHYDLHSLYGHYEAKVTFNVLKSIDPTKRPFILTRSTFAGTGRYAHHWTGDVDSSWDAMKQSVPDILNLNLFGIPFVGADVCGFFNNATEEMCLRWTQLGSYYSFMRNHNGLGYIDQDPAAWKNGLSKMKDALYARYNKIPYLYTLHYQAYREQQTVIRPLWWEFPIDKNTWSINYQFMVGSAIMVVPVMEEVDKVTNTSTVKAYFPEGDWYSEDGRRHNFTAHEENLVVGLNEIPVFYRGGSVVPLQTAKTTTYESRKSYHHLLVALDYASQTASGKLYFDSGDQIEVGPGPHGTEVTFKFSPGLLETSVAGNFNPTTVGFSGSLGSITFFGFKQEYAGITTDIGKINNYNYNPATERMDINVDIDLTKNFKLKWNVPSAANNVVAPVGLLALLLLIQRMFN